MSKFWSRSSSSSSSDYSSIGTESSGTDHSGSDESIFQEDLSLDQDLAWSMIESAQLFLDPPNVVTQALSRSLCTRVVCMSDTHAKHRDVFVPKGDVLIHSGDLTKTGEIGTVRDVSEFFGGLDFESILCIAGNHELTFEPECYDRVWRKYHPSKFDAEETRQSLKNCTYLEDTSCTIRGGIEVYGSPWQPEFFGWAFNLDRGQPLREVWAKIPSSTDILITHGPPLGRGDICNLKTGGRAGCYDLLKEVQNRVKPRLHVFGHVHEGYGVSNDGDTMFVNASNLTWRYEATNPCIVVDLPHDTSKAAMLVRPTCQIASQEDLVRWLEEKHYNCLAQHVESATSDKIPTRNALLNDCTFDDMCDTLMIHRDKKATTELRRALMQLYAESYEERG